MINALKLARYHSNKLYLLKKMSKYKNILRSFKEPEMVLIEAFLSTIKGICLGDVSASRLRAVKFYKSGKEKMLITK